MTYVSNLEAPQEKSTRNIDAMRICATIESMPPRDREIMKGIVEMMLITARGRNFKIEEVK